MELVWLFRLADDDDFIIRLFYYDLSKRIRI
jgi:hypothetical protein